MFIEVLAEDGKSGLINEMEVQAISPNSYDDKAKLVLVSRNPKDGSPLILYSALSYSDLVERLTFSHPPYVKLDADGEPLNQVINQSVQCFICAHPQSWHWHDATVEFEACRNQVCRCVKFTYPPADKMPMN